MLRKIFALDVGGTGIKAGIASIDTTEDTVIVGEYPSCSEKSKDEIMENFKLIFNELIQVEKSPYGIALAFPGDFDYQNGICLMKNVGKYDSIYKTDMKAVFNKLFSSDSKLSDLYDKPIRFLNDVSAFAVGACMDIPNAKSERSLCVCIGTGCGSAFLLNGRLAGDEILGVPQNGWIYSIPYKESIIDDYLSKRGLLSITQSAYGRPVEGYELSQLAQSGDVTAQKCFDEFGHQIADALNPIIKGFKPNRIIFGGQIAKSYELFGKQLSEMCRSIGIEITITVQTSKYALKGLTTLFDKNILN